MAFKICQQICSSWAQQHSRWGLCKGQVLSEDKEANVKYDIEGMRK